MTLAPDHLAYTRPGETTDAPETVSVIPDRKWKHLTQPPVDAPELTDLALARDIILAHLADGENNGDPAPLTWARIANDLNNHKAVTYPSALYLIADYAHWAKLNGGTDWTPGDADELRAAITRHLRAAGYTEVTQ